MIPSESRHALESPCVHWYENRGTRLIGRTRHSREGGNPGDVEGRHQQHPNASSDANPFPYLGVPAPTGMSDCYESMSRTTIRDGLRPPISSFRRRPESRGVVGGANFHTTVCRRQPA